MSDLSDYPGAEPYLSMFRAMLDLALYDIAYHERDRQRGDFGHGKTGADAMVRARALRASSAKRWILGEEEGFFSFSSCCEFLNVCARATRKVIRENPSSLMALHYGLRPAKTKKKRKRRK